MTRRLVEVESLAAFDRLTARARTLNGWFVRSVDLSQRSAVLQRVDPQGAVFLGCVFAAEDEERLRARGGLVFPRLPDLPFDPYRGALYDADQLYGSGDYAASPDAAIYAWSRASIPRTVSDELAVTLHDHAIADALDDATAEVAPTQLVGVMGGHALLRGERPYTAAAELGAALTRAGRTVVTGGGPGAMEAANLGAYLSPWPGALAEAIALLSASPGYRDDIDSWARAGLAVRRQWPAEQAGSSVSIPTWFYGHEPSGVFATQIAKYFTNALREDTLLHRCRGGIIYLPGQAGTVQEIFQAVTENFYAADPTQVAPMVLVGVDYWTTTLPAWPLLERLGSGRAMGSVIHCVDDVGEAAALITAAPRSTA